MDIQELMTLTPESLASKQYLCLQKAVLTLLEEFAEHIKKGDIESAGNMLTFSPAGDDMGCDNYFINCSQIYGLDLYDVLRKLKGLKDIAGED